MDDLAERMVSAQSRNQVAVPPHFIDSGLTLCVHSAVTSVRAACAGGADNMAKFRMHDNNSCTVVVPFGIVTMKCELIVTE